MVSQAIGKVFKAARMFGPQRRTLQRGLLGDPESRSPEYCPYSEFQLSQVSNWSKAAQTLAHLLIPASSQRPPRWVRHRPRLKPVVRLLLRPTKVFRYHDTHCWPDPTPDQAWFFLNGIGADRHVLLLNAAYLGKLFGRPLTLLHNASCGLLADLAECTVDRGSRGIAEAARKAFAPIYVALKQPSCKRVILIAHSQGTVVTSVLLWLLRALYPATAAQALNGEPGCPEQQVAQHLAHQWGFPSADEAARRGEQRGSAAVRPPLSAHELAKLEIYTFGNCASGMSAIDKHRSLPFIESFGNEHDPLARLGVLASDTGHSFAPIGGERYLRPQAWGHLLNAHYLHPLERDRQDQVAGLARLVGLPGNRLQGPRLLEYLQGQTPPALPAA